MYENTQKTKQTNTLVQKQPKIKETGMSKTSKNQTNSHVQKQPKIKQTGMSKTSKKKPNKRTSEIYLYSCKNFVYDQCLC